MKLPALLREQQNLHQFNLYCLTQDGKVSRHKLVLFYKMIIFLSPEYLSSLVPPTVGNISQYNLRNETNLQTIPARSQQYYISFFPSTTYIWNSLPDDTTNSPSVESFKHKLKTTTLLLFWLTIRTNILCPHTIELLTEVSSFPEKTPLIILCVNAVRLKILHTFSYTAISTDN